MDAELRKQTMVLRGKLNDLNSKFERIIDQLPVDDRFDIMISFAKLYAKQIAIYKHLNNKSDSIT